MGVLRADNALERDLHRIRKRSLERLSTKTFLDSLESLPTLPHVIAEAHRLEAANLRAASYVHVGVAIRSLLREALLNLGVTQIGRSARILYGLDRVDLSPSMIARLPKERNVTDLMRREAAAAEAWGDQGWHHFRQEIGTYCRFRGLFHRPGSGGQRSPSDSMASAMTACCEW